MKKFVALLLAACMILTTGVVTFAGESDFDYENYYRAREPKNGEKYVIGYTYYWSTEFITLMNEGVARAAEKYDVDVIYLDAQNDTAQQLSQVDSLIAQDVDALLVANVDADAIVPAWETAKEADIPMFFVNMEINTEDPHYYAGPDDVLAGYLEASAGIEKVGKDDGVVCILDGPIGQVPMLERQAGNYQALEENPGWELRAEQTANWERDQAQAIVENWLETWDDIDMIIGQNDAMGLGAILAIEAKGLVPNEDIVVVGVDAIEDACIAVKEGKQLCTVYQDAGLEGELGIQICVDTLQGNPPEEYSNRINMTNYFQDTVDELLDTLYAKDE